MVGIPEKGRTKLPEVVRAEQVDGKSTRGFGDFRAKKWFIALSRGRRP